MTDMVRIYPPPDDSADEIAREIMYGSNTSMVPANRDWFMGKIAAALRAYGASQRNAGLEEATTAFAGGMHTHLQIVRTLRALKSAPESKPESKEPTA